MVPLTSRGFDLSLSWTSCSYLLHTLLIPFLLSTTIAGNALAAGQLLKAYPY